MLRHFATVLFVAGLTLASGFAEAAYNRLPDGRTWQPTRRVDISAEVTTWQAECDAGEDANTNVYSSTGDLTDARLNEVGIFYHCIEAGDYRSHNLPTIDQDGTSGQHRVYLHDDCGSGHPNRLAAASQARFGELDIRADYVDTYCLTVNDATNVSTNSTFSLINVENADNVRLFDTYAHDSDDTLLRIIGGVSNIHVQDFVGHTTELDSSEAACILLRHETADGAVADIVITGGQVWNCHGDVYQQNTDDSTESSGFNRVYVEDLEGYVTDAYYTDCGTGALDINGNCGCSENAVDVKLSNIGAATSANANQFRGNIFYGFQSVPASQSACPAVGNPVAPCFDFHGVPSGNNEADYLVVASNICMDAESGIYHSLSDPDHNSYINNLFYNVTQTGSGNSSSSVFTLFQGDTTEAYFNMVINSGEWIDLNSGSTPVTNFDIRGNGLIFSGSGDVLTPGSGSVVNAQSVIRSSTGSYDAGTSTLVDVTDVNPRANSTAYSTGDFYTFGGFIFKVTSGGTTAAAPTINEMVGSTTVDGTATVKAVLGPGYVRVKRYTTDNTWVKLDYADIDRQDSESPFFGLPGDQGIGCVDDRGVNDAELAGQTC